MPIEQAALDLLDRLSAARDRAHAVDLLRRAIAPFGFTSLVMSDLPSPRVTTNPEVYALDAPPGWYQHYVEGGHYAHDPVARRARQTTRPFVWSEAAREADDGPAAARVMREASDFGLEDGFTVPIMEIGGGQSVLSLGGPQRAMEACDRHALHIMCVYTHHAVRRLACTPCVPGMVPSGRWVAAADDPAPHPDLNLHVVTRENRHRYRRELAAAFDLRRRAYVIERGWPSFADPSSRDRYDDDEAIYLIAIEASQRHVVGGCRLHPVRRPAQMELVPGLGRHFALPGSPSTFHLSRVVVAAERRDGDAMNRVRATILAGLQEYCLDEEIETLTALVPMVWLPTYLALGWNPYPLALPEAIFDDTAVLATFDVSEVALRRTLSVHDRCTPVVVKRGITRAAVPSLPGSTRLN
jgi:N-acyl-L-homoserine lactone synthetase